MGNEDNGIINDNGQKKNLPMKMVKNAVDTVAAAVHGGKERDKKKKLGEGFLSRL